MCVCVSSGFLGMFSFFGVFCCVFLFDVLVWCVFWCFLWLIFAFWFVLLFSSMSRPIKKLSSHPVASPTGSFHGFTVPTSTGTKRTRTRKGQKMDGN